MNIFRFRLELTNPFDRWDYFKSLGCISGRLFKHTAWELEHTFYSPMLCDIDIDWKIKSDHAGFYLGLALLGYGVGFRIYDTRHWNYDLKQWEEYNFDEHTQTNS